MAVMETQPQTDYKTQREPECLTYNNVRKGPDSCNMVDTSFM